jgi:hypothetical protein
VGDFEFAQLSSTASWTTSLFGDHQMGITGYAITPLGGGQVPRQRWSVLGGPGTLPTFPAADQYGDNLLFGNFAYMIPVKLLRIPVAGYPNLRFEYLVGDAWQSGEETPRARQNIGLGIQFLIFKGMVYINPEADPVKGKAVLGAQLSGGMSLPNF